MIRIFLGKKKNREIVHTYWMAIIEKQNKTQKTKCWPGRGEIGTLIPRW